MKCIATVMKPDEASLVSTKFEKSDLSQKTVSVVFRKRVHQDKQKIEFWKYNIKTAEDL